MGTSKRKASRQIARPKKSRRTMRGSSGLMRSVRQTKVHSFVRKSTLATVQGNAAYAPYNIGAQSWTLSNVVNYTEFTALYEQYKLNWIKLSFHLKIDPSSQSGTTAGGWTPAYFPKLYLSSDHTDDAAATITEFRERANTRIKVMKPDQMIHVWVKPSLLAEVYRGLTTTTYEPKYGVWLPTSTPDAKFYGLKWAIDDLRNTNYYIDIETTYYFDMKNAQ